MPTSSIKLSFYIWMLRVIFIEVKMIFLRMQFPYSYQIKVALSSRKECLELKFWGRIKKQSPPYPPDSAECCPPSWSNGRLRPLASATWSNKPNTWKSYKIQEKKKSNHILTLTQPHEFPVMVSFIGRWHGLTHKLLFLPGDLLVSEDPERLYRQMDNGQSLYRKVYNMPRKPSPLSPINNPGRQPAVSQICGLLSLVTIQKAKE